MSAPDIPTGYTITQHIPNPVVLDTSIDGDLRTELAGGVRTELAGGVRTELAGGVRTELAGGVSMTLLGDPARPIAARMNVEMELANLPRFTLGDIQELMAQMKRTRVRMPINLNFGMSVFPFNLFGIDVVQFSLCGEPQLIVDDYVPNAYERCEVECEPCEDGDD
jgi:hypothetical protein